MIVVLEGIERSGKSTLAKYFESIGFVNFKDRVHTEEYSYNSMLQRYSGFVNFLMALNNQNINIVLDRFHISDIVYRKEYRSDNSICTYDYFVDDLLASMNAKLILCTREINKTFIEQYPYNRDASKITKINEAFKYYFDKSTIKNKYIFDLSKNSIIPFVDKILNFKYDFYLASPFFNESQKLRENKVKTILRSNGYSVYAPMEHGIVGSISDHSFVEMIFNSNIEAIKNSKYILAITDEKDMGTIWEAGFAYGINKPIVYFAETLGDKPFNIMLSESGVGIFKTLDDLKNASENNKWNEKAEVHYE